VRSAGLEELDKELQRCAEALPAELKGFADLAADSVVKLSAVLEESAAAIEALRSTHQRPVESQEAKYVQESEEATKSLELLRAGLDKVARQLTACANQMALIKDPLDERARSTLHAGLLEEVLGTKAAAAAESKVELAPLLAAAEALQAAAKPAADSWLGALGGRVSGFFGRIAGVKRARE
jgi:hypothetical protein